MPSDKQPLPPLPKRLDGDYQETELHFVKCKHDLEIHSSTEVRCKKCGAGWTGQDVYKLIAQET